MIVGIANLWKLSTEGVTCETVEQGRQFKIYCEEKRNIMGINLCVEDGIIRVYNTEFNKNNPELKTFLLIISVIKSNWFYPTWELRNVVAESRLILMFEWH